MSCLGGGFVVSDHVHDYGEVARAPGLLAVTGTARIVVVMIALNIFAATWHAEGA
jgi:hypothetical protein